MRKRALDDFVAENLFIVADELAHVFLPKDHLAELLAFSPAMRPCSSTTFRSSSALSGPGFKLCCGTKQIMETPNVFYTRGRCEECGAKADIRADGCNAPGEIRTHDLCLQSATGLLLIGNRRHENVQ